MNKDLMISAIKTKLRKQAGVMGTMLRNPFIPGALGYSVLTTAGETTQGSRPGYYATDYLRNAGDNLIYFSPQVPVAAKLGNAFLQPLKSIPGLARTDPLADPTPYGMPEHEM